MSDVIGDVIGFLGSWQLIQPSESQSFDGIDIDPNTLILKCDNASIVFLSLEACLVYFVDSWINTIGLPYADGLLKSWDEGELLKRISKSSLFDFVFYNVNTVTHIYNLVENCKKLPNPYDNNWNFEVWLLSNIGEYIFFCMNENSALSNVTNKYSEILSNIELEMFGNITFKPSGYPGTKEYTNRFKEIDYYHAAKSTHRKIFGNGFGGKR